MTDQRTALLQKAREAYASWRWAHMNVSLQFWVADCNTGREEFHEPFKYDVTWADAEGAVYNDDAPGPDYERIPGVHARLVTRSGEVISTYHVWFSRKTGGFAW